MLLRCAAAEPISEDALALAQYEADFAGAAGSREGLRPKRGIGGAALAATARAAAPPPAVRWTGPLASKFTIPSELLFPGTFDALCEHGKANKK